MSDIRTDVFHLETEPHTATTSFILVSYPTVPNQAAPASGAATWLTQGQSAVSTGKSIEERTETWFLHSIGTIWGSRGVFDPHDHYPDI